jgi:hypothetical protein
MRRREFISLAGFMAVARPLVTRAQQAGMKRGGALMSIAQTNAEEAFSDGYENGRRRRRKRCRPRGPISQRQMSLKGSGDIAV